MKKRKEKYTYVNPTLTKLGKMKIVTKDNEAGSFADNSGQPDRYSKKP